MIYKKIIEVQTTRKLKKDQVQSTFTLNYRENLSGIYHRSEVSEDKNHHTFRHEARFQPRMKFRIIFLESLVQIKNIKFLKLFLLTLFSPGEQWQPKIFSPTEIDENVIHEICLTVFRDEILSSKQVITFNQSILSSS